MQKVTEDLKKKKVMTFERFWGFFVHFITISTTKNEEQKEQSLQLFKKLHIHQRNWVSAQSVDAQTNISINKSPSLSP